MSVDAVVEEFVYWRLVSDPRTARWFGFRVTPVVAEQDAAVSPEGDVIPFAVYRRISVLREPVLDLTVADSPRVQIAVDAYAGTYADAKAAAAAVLAVMNKATEPQFGTKILVCLHQTEQDDISIPVNGKEVPIYSVTQTFDILVDE